MMEAPLDAFVAQLMAQLQLQTALAAAHQAYAPTDESEADADVHLAVAKPYAPDDAPTTSESATESVPPASTHTRRKLTLPSSSSSAVASLKVVVESLQRAVARGSAFYNAGRADLCARLYFQTVAQVAQVLAQLGETDAAAFLSQLLVQASKIAAADNAAWTLRDGIERLVASIRAVPQYAAVFASSDVDSSSSDDHTCAYGLLVQWVGSELRVFETRCSTECDEDLDTVDAIFFVEEASSSSSSSEEEEEPSELGDGAAPSEIDGDAVDDSTTAAALPEHQQSRHSLWRSMGTCALLGMGCAVLLLMVAWRRRLAKIRQMRERAAAAQQQQRVFGAVSNPFAKTPSMPLNHPYATLV
jgi:hypothetical protein